MTKPIIQTIPISLGGNSNNISTIHLEGGSYIRIEKSDFPVRLRLDDIDCGEFKSGGWLKSDLKNDGSQRLTVENTHTENNKVIVRYGNVLVGTDESIIAGTVITKQVVANALNGATKAITSTVSQLLSSNSQRLAVELKNKGGSTIYIADNADIDISQATEIEPNETKEIAINCDLFGVCATGETSTLKIVEGLYNV